MRGVNLFFETDLAKAVTSADIILVSVSTPLKHSGMGANFAPDLQHWERIARLIAEASPEPKLIVERSTVPVRTADVMATVLCHNSGGAKWTVLSNPEFAREGNAMVDHASPERIMIGAGNSDAAKAAAESLVAIYRQWVPADKIIVSGIWSAELSKLTANAFLAQRISSINAISALCGKQSERASRHYSAPSSVSPPLAPPPAATCCQPAASLPPACRASPHAATRAPCLPHLRSPQRCAL